jgi:hypothetical protein
MTDNLTKPSAAARPDAGGYAAFLDRKAQIGTRSGFAPIWMPDFLFDFQKSLVEWALLKGKAAIIADCGLGKSPMELVWAENVRRKTNKPTLILSPLAVSNQMVREAEKFGIECKRSNDGTVHPNITTTNYERLHLFNPDDWGGVACDESSILKNFTGQRKKDITRFMSKVQYRLLGTATAAPNDFVELGTSSEALGELPYMDVLQRFFVDDKDRKGSDKPGAASYSKERQAARVHGYWRLKGHSESAFWRWVCSWARACRKPSDLGFSDDQFKLPPLIVNETKIKNEKPLPGEMFIWKAVSLADQRTELRATLQQRCEMVAELCAQHPVSVLWCDLNDEGDLLEKIIPGAVQIAGKDCDEAKEEKFEAFLSGKIKRLVTKGKIAGFGLNLQLCNHTTFFPSHSWEKYYQSVRRFWRFGQKKPVYVDIVTTEGEAGVLQNLQRKSAQADKMFDRLVASMNESLNIERNGKQQSSIEIPSWITQSN